MILSNVKNSHQAIIQGIASSESRFNILKTFIEEDVVQGMGLDGCRFPVLTCECN